MTTKEKKNPLPIRELDRYTARVSTTEIGQWTILEQLKGETFVRLFARARDVQSAATILHALWKCGKDVDFVKPAAIVLVSSGAPGAESIAVDVYADGSAFRAVTAELVPTERILKRDQVAWVTDTGDSLRTAIEAILAKLAADAALGGGS